MPVAEPDSPAKLDRMSWRTTPVWLSTFAPLEPSPGYGPAVSSGILLHAPACTGVGARGAANDVRERAAAAEQGECASAEPISQEVAATERGSRGGEVAVPCGASHFRSE